MARDARMTPVPGGLEVPGPHAEAAPNASSAQPSGRVRCAHCSGETPEGFPFCQQCGQRLQASAAAPAEWGILHELLSNGAAGESSPLTGAATDIGRSADIAIDDACFAHRHARI